MLSAKKEIGVSSLGMRESSIKAREAIEENQKEPVLKLVKGALNRLEKVTKTESGKPAYISFAITKYMEEFGISPEDKAIKNQLSYQLRGAKNIVTELGKATNRVVPDNMKPFAYSFVSEEQKKRMGLSAYCMKNLTDEMKEYIQDRTKKINAESDIYDLLIVCDFLTAREADKKWVKLMGLKLSADLGQPIRKTRQAIEDLIRANVLVTGQFKRSTRGKETICHLAYDIQEYSKLNNQILSGEAFDEFNKKGISNTMTNARLLMRNIETESEKVSEIQTKAMAEVLENNADNKGLGLLNADNSHSQTVSLDEIKNGNGVIPDEIVMASLAQLMQRLNEQQNCVKTQEEKDKKSAHLQELLEASQLENTRLREELANTEAKLSSTENILEKHKKFNGAYASEALKAMNQLMSEVNKKVVEYTQKNPKDITVDDTSDFENGVINAVTAAQNRLKDFTYSSGVEPLKK